VTTTVPLRLWWPLRCQVADLISDRYSLSNVSVEPLKLQAVLGRERQRIALLVDDDGRFAGSVTLASLSTYWHTMDKEARQEKLEQSKQDGTEQDSAESIDVSAQVSGAKAHIDEVDETVEIDKDNSTEKSDKPDKSKKAAEVVYALAG